MYVTFLLSRTTVVHNTTDRRSQVIITGQSVSSRSGYAPEDNRSLDEEANYESGGPSGITPEGEDAHTRIHTSEHVNDDLMSELGWEEDTSTPLTGSRPASVPTLSYGYPRLQSESDYRRADKRWGKSKRPHVSTSGRSTTRAREFGFVKPYLHYAMGYCGTTVRLPEARRDYGLVIL